MEDDLRRVQRDLGLARRSAGLSLQAVGGACGVASSTAWRTESGDTRAPDLLLLAGMAAAVGHDVRLQIYPAGDPIRDAAQQRLLDRFRREIPASISWRTEVVLDSDRDLRAWDAVIGRPGWSLAVEAETVVSDVQALERRIARKMRDGRMHHVLLLVADTRRNRGALAAAPSAFAGFDRGPRLVLRALRSGADPARSAIVFF